MRCGIYFPPVREAMKGWGIRIQIGRTTITPGWCHPKYWGWQESLMAPSLYGFGIWVTRDLWGDA